MTTTTATTTTTTTTTTTATTATTAASRYLPPDRMTRSVMNPLITALVKLGVPIRGSRQLLVRGRTTGEWRCVPVNPIEVDGERYLVAPRGNTHWVRNLRSAGAGRLRLRRRSTDFVAVELADSEKTPILRAYLGRWAFEVGKFFEGVDETSPDERLAEVASGFPVFRITPR